MSTVLIEQSYRFALDPEAAQGETVNSWLGASRYWYNAGLAEVKARLDRRAAGEQDVDLPWSYKGLCSVLNAAWREEQAPWVSEVPCGTYMAGFEALGAALRNFSAAKPSGQRVGFPKFKRKGRCQESVLFQRPRVLDARRVEFTSALGPVRVKERMTKLLRLLERDGHARITRATITCRGRHYYVSFTVKRSPKLRRPKRPDHSSPCDLKRVRSYLARACAAAAALNSIGILGVVDFEIVNKLGLVRFVRLARRLGLLGLLPGHGWSFPCCAAADPNGTAAI